MDQRNDIWDNERSFISPEKDGEEKYWGRIFIHGADMRFSISRQASGSYLYRGTMSAICPNRERVIAIDVPSEDGTTKERISRSVYSNENTLEKLKPYLAEKAYDLYSAYSRQINQMLKRSVRKETIMPDVACSLYGKDFIDYKYPDVNKQTKDKYYNRINKHYNRFPDIPMSEYTPKVMGHYIADNGLKGDAVRVLHDFWMYCLDKGVCMGTDPFPAKQKPKKSPQSLTQKATRPDELSEDTQELLFQKCLDENDGLSCAVALLLWAGLGASVVRDFVWSSIVFDEEDLDKAYLLLLIPDYAGATHIYNRPIFVQGARILRKRYDSLQHIDKAELLNLPVASKADNPYEKMSQDSLVKNATTLLRNCGVLNRTFAELREPRNAVSMRLFANTYRANLERKCGLIDDEYTSKFMRGESLRGSTTCDSYVSFTDDDAIDRLYSVIKVTKPVEEYDTDIEDEILDNGGRRYRVYPRSSKLCAGVTMQMIIRPGEQIQIQDCFHGVRGSLVVRSVGSNGKPKRKSRKKRSSAKDIEQNANTQLEMDLP